MTDNISGLRSASQGPLLCVPRVSRERPTSLESIMTQSSPSSKGATTAAGNSSPGRRLFSRRPQQPASFTTLATTVKNDDAVVINSSSSSSSAASPSQKTALSLPLSSVSPTGTRPVAPEVSSPETLSLRLVPLLEFKSPLQQRRSSSTGTVTSQALTKSGALLRTRSNSSTNSTAAATAVASTFATHTLSVTNNSSRSLDCPLYLFHASTETSESGAAISSGSLSTAGNGSLPNETEAQQQPAITESTPRRRVACLSAAMIRQQHQNSHHNESLGSFRYAAPNAATTTTTSPTTSPHTAAASSPHSTSTAWPRHVTLRPPPPSPVRANRRVGVSGSNSNRQASSSSSSSLQSSPMHDMALLLDQDENDDGAAIGATAHKDTTTPSTAAYHAYSSLDPPSSPGQRRRHRHHHHRRRATLSTTTTTATVAGAGAGAGAPPTTTTSPLSSPRQRQRQVRRASLASTATSAAATATHRTIRPPHHWTTRSSSVGSRITRDRDAVPDGEWHDASRPVDSSPAPQPRPDDEKDNLATTTTADATASLPSPGLRLGRSSSVSSQLGHYGWDEPPRNSFPSSEAASSPRLRRYRFTRSASVSSHRDLTAISNNGNESKDMVDDATNGHTESSSPARQPQPSPKQQATLSKQRLRRHRCRHVKTVAPLHHSMPSLESATTGEEVLSTAVEPAKKPTLTVSSLQW
jgi:trimeric autotransporter adhesin